MLAIKSLKVHQDKMISLTSDLLQFLPDFEGETLNNFYTNIFGIVLMSVVCSYF